MTALPVPEPEDATPCFGYPEPFDQLIDAAGWSPQNRYAARTALAMCCSCPIQSQCWQENAEEPWMPWVVQEAKWEARAREEARLGLRSMP